jgi:two-component system response regulator RegX3
MLRILIVEDEESYRDPLTFQLAREGFEVLEAASGPEALAVFEAHGADLVLLDLMLPGLPGTEVCRRLRQVSDVPVIMLTAKDDEIDKVVGLELGADDYVTKPYSFRELLARIRAVLRRKGPTEDGETASGPGAVFAGGVVAGNLDGALLAAARGPRPAAGLDADDDILVAGPVQMDVDRHVVTVHERDVALPLKEFELLEYLLRNADRVLTRGRLIDRIWGSNYVGDTKTLDVHVKRLRAKIEPDPANPQHLLTIRGLGYKITG